MSGHGSGKGVQRSPWEREAFDLDLKIWLKFRYVKTGSREKEIVAYQTYGVLL